jgi:predicted DNA-binding transcriptional regulator YafY
VGRSSIHRAKRAFHLGGILSAETLDDHFQVPHGFSIERHLGNAWHMITEKGRDSAVVVRFNPLVAKNVAEVHRHKTQRLVWCDDSLLDFHATVSGINEISWWILGCGDQAEVLEPIELRRRVADRANRMAAIYESGGQLP